jgi:hypothetical protein
VRLYLTAGLSLLDLPSDASVALSFLSSGETYYGLLLLSMIALSILLQLVTVWIQNRKAGTLSFIMLKELMIVCTGLKPVVDASRVGRGKEQKKHQLFDPATELAVTKCIEIATESIPGERSECSCASARKARVLLPFCGGSGRARGLSGGDPPNPPLGRRGRTCSLARVLAGRSARTGC